MYIEFQCADFVKCPLCNKCRNVMDHLYDNCRRCGFSRYKCKHTHKEINLMIKRDNFRLRLSESAKGDIRQLMEEYKQNVKKKQ